MKIILLFLLLLSVTYEQIYIEEVMDCVSNTCESVRTNCGIDEDCRKSYNNFTTCIIQQSEQTYIQCKTNGFMTWVNVMDCYSNCHYFELKAKLFLYYVIMLLLIQ